MRIASLLLILLLVPVGLYLSACGVTRSGEQRLMIRIRNDSRFDIDNFWLGAGPEGGSTRDTAYGAIVSGTATDYYAVEPVFANYRKMNMVIADQRYYGVIDPAQYVGTTELAPGWYTFAYDLVDGDPVLTLIQDEPQ